MNELKERTMDVIDSINKDWSDSFKTIQDYLKEVEAKGMELDLSVMMGKFAEASNTLMAKYSGNLKKLDQHFRDASERVGKNRKKSGGWLG